MDLTTKVNLVRSLLTTKELPAQKGAELLEVNRTSIYYKGTPISEEELACKAIMDRIHTDNPARGARQIKGLLHDDMLPPCRTMKYKSPIWGYFYV